jgi:hypothetical protein
MKIIHAALLVIAAAGPAAAFDHMNPVALHAAAIESVREGDLKTADILLARAARLAPGDARIARARKALEAKRAGEEVAFEAPPQAATKPVAEKAKPPAVPAEPPPLWPPR